MPARKFHHATIREPGEFEPGSFRTLRFLETGGYGARVIIGRVKGETKRTTQALLFPASWTRRRVEEWMDLAGRRGVRIEWANPAVTPGALAGLRVALEFSLDHIRQARRYIEIVDPGDASFAQAEMKLAEKALHRGAAFAGIGLRDNPAEERYTTAQTSIREALVHLVQADKNAGRGEIAAALEALEAAHEHIDQAQDRLEKDEAATRNPCRPARNASPVAPAWNPSPDDNPFKMDRQLLAYFVQKAHAKRLPAVSWKHPKAGFIFTHPKTSVPFDVFKKRETERIAQLGGKVIRWYPVRGTASARKNPPAPRQLVRLGDVIEVHLASGKGYRWKRGEAAMLVSPGLEKDSRGRGRLVLSPLRGAKPAGEKQGPHKTSERTYETWHGKLPQAKKAQIADVPGPDEFSKSIGKAKSIVYSSTKWQKRPASYIHEFEVPLPTLYAGPVGTFELRGGGFRVTARGIVG